MMKPTVSLRTAVLSLTVVIAASGVLAGCERRTDPPTPSTDTGTTGTGSTTPGSTGTGMGTGGATGTGTTGDTTGTGSTSGGTTSGSTTGGTGTTDSTTTSPMPPASGASQ